MQPTALQDRPPFVSFEVRAEEDRQASIEAGHYVTKDFDYALVTPAGSKDRVEQKVVEWFAKLRTQVREERFPAAWLENYESAYKAWKSGQEIPLDGTAIKNWPILSPSQVRTLLELNVRTVEDLAAANEELVVRLGMGGRSLRDKAREWAKAKGGDAGKQAEEIVALRLKLEAAETARAAMETELRALMAQVQALAPKAPAAAPKTPTK